MKAGKHADDIRTLVRHLDKPPEAWRRKDLLRYCLVNGIRVLNLRYPSFDGKLRELRLPVNDKRYLERVLAAGERVDGSSLFPGLFDAGSSDLYAVPVYRWAFLNPWARDELDVVCRFADRDGEPAAVPEGVLSAAAAGLRERTGAELQALAELEFYLLLEREDDRFSGKTQRSYHQSAPYVHGHEIAGKILRHVAAVTGRVKYCHAEVGYIDKLESEDPELDGRRVEQFELELELMPIDELGTWLPVARWLIREVAARHGASATFVPKLDEGMAGSGMHLHLALARDGENVMLGEGGELSADAMRLVGGLLGRAGPLTAFGNTVAASYLRLVPDQEAPTRICWGRRNRSSLVRVPLDFRTPRRLDQAMNPDEDGPYPGDLARPTIEYRSPDGTAFAHLLLAAVTLAVEEGLTSPDSLDLARRLEVEGNVFKRPEVKDALERLPSTAVAAARRLADERSFFEAGGFPPRLVELVIEKLEAEADEGLDARLRALPAAERLVESRRLMHKDLHKH
ncbi:MAG: glutamine synthetase [bacterium]|nr:glutamine synthetase [bacterium]